jgi:PHD/YefM family antitoxin component YafN of YafNO toxin-antitoxin module
MTITAMSSQEFNENIGRAKKAAQDGPVLITDVGRPGFVLITMEEYQRLTGNPCESRTLADALAMPGTENIDFDPPRMQGPVARVPTRRSRSSRTHLPSNDSILARTTEKSVLT